VREEVGFGFNCRPAGKVERHTAADTCIRRFEVAEAEKGCLDGDLEA
jgi:hypothetical protein